jgi:hypothetical protein
MPDSWNRANGNPSTWAHFRSCGFSSRTRFAKPSVATRESPSGASEASEDSGLPFYFAGWEGGNAVGPQYRGVRITTFPIGIDHSLKSTSRQILNWP